MQIPLRTGNNTKIEILIYGAYVPTVKSTIICRYDLTTFGKLSSRGQPENRMYLQNTNADMHDEYIECEVINKQNFLIVDNSNDECKISIDAIDPNHQNNMC